MPFFGAVECENYPFRIKNGGGLWRPLYGIICGNSDFSAQTEEDKRRLEENRRLAKRLGASLETVYGDDVPYQIAEFARLSGVTKIVLGRSAARRKLFWGRPALTEQLISYAPETDIYIIPDQNADSSYRPKTLKERRKADVAKIF